MRLRNTAWFLGIAMVTLANPTRAHDSPSPSNPADKPRHDHNAHHHHGHAHGHGQQAGQSLGQQLNNQGNYDLMQRMLINETARRALENSAKIDKMLQNNDISQEGWSQLKNTMTDSMMNAIDQQTQEMPVLAPIDTRSTVLDGPMPVTEVNINVAGPTIAPPPGAEKDLETQKGEAAPEDALAALEDDKSAAPAKDVVDLRAAAPYILAMDRPNGDATAPSTTPIENSGPATEIQVKGAAAIDPLNHDNGPGRAELNEKKNLLLAQRLLQTSAKAGKPTSAEAPKKRKSVVGRTLTKVAKLFGLNDKEIPKAITATGFRQSDTEASALALPEMVEADAELEAEAILFEWDELFLLAFIALLATGFAGSVYLLRRRSKLPVQVLVPGSGEHFTIRAGDNDGDFVLDVKDVRGQLIRSAGMLRPASVARAAVLPPALAAQLGAQSSFDRFEFTAERRFERTQKEEGYQVFPFVIENHKKAS